MTSVGHDDLLSRWRTHLRRTGKTSFGSISLVRENLRVTQGKASLILYVQLVLCRYSISPLPPLAFTEGGG